MMQPTTPVHIRPMTVDDIAAVIAIEQTSFPTVWPEAAYRREIGENRLSEYYVAVAPADPSVDGTHEGEIWGYLGLWFMVDEVHIVTIAVREDLRRLGIGADLVRCAIARARVREADNVTLEVRVSNTGAQTLYTRFGFRRLGIRKRYYEDNGEDALIMTTPSLTDPDYLAFLQALAGRATPPS